MFQLSLTDRLAQIDCRRTGQAEGYYRCKLSRNLSHRICRHGRASQMSQNCRIGGSPHSPHNFVRDDRKGIFHKVAEQRPVRVQDIFRAELDLLIKKPGISRRQYHFKNTSAQSSQRRAGDSHCRQPEQAENKDRVHHNITE